MERYFAHLEICFLAKDELSAEQNAQWIVDRIKRGFVLPTIDVIGADAFCVERLGA
jgi:hypothetical protein